MSGSVTLLNIAGAVALLLWAARMVRTGVDRAHGARLRQFLEHAAATRLGAAGSGMVLAVGLQGSTAVALLVTGALTSGLMTAPVGLSILLGADLGSALVVRILSLDLSLLVPVLLVAGVTTFLTGERRSVRQAGRIVIGIALMLLALRLLGEASQPLKESRLLPLVIDFLREDPITAFLLAALLTWLMHSGVAAVLLLASLCAADIVPIGLALVLLLGINLGSGIIATLLTRTLEPPASTVPVANFVLRAALAVAGVIALRWIDADAIFSGTSPAAVVVGAHIAVNAAVVVVGLPLVGPVIRLIETLRPAAGQSDREGESSDINQTTSLDPRNMLQPKQAITGALREILRMSDTVTIMLQEAFEAFSDGDRKTIEQIAGLDDEVDQLHANIKRYLTEVGRHDLSEEEKQRCNELMWFCIRLEQIGDITVKNLLPLAEKKRARKLAFSKHGWHELRDLHARVADNLQLALNVLASADVSSARALTEEKRNVRQLEQASLNRHMERLRKGTVKSIESSEIHLDMIRDLLQINSLLTSVAYPILERRGASRDSGASGAPSAA
ncbi:Na/Pi cotransporter family protein [Nitratireductor sp. XY-223]|uniref:Na/Pi cotransporter family protein n=1 Tax=Nitratireductor sp. XY-223 TaxID=2561926 RepID=UPI0010AAC697|nr:Na/Pi cotransporter family protein [Nitratireductor sp. XY-223]